MSEKYKTLLAVIANLTIFHINWFVVILSAASHRQTIGVIVVAATLLMHLYVYRKRRAEFLFILIVLFIGSFADAILIAMGAFDLGEGAVFAGMVAPFMMALWVNFAMLLNVSLRWLKGKYCLGSLLALLGAPTTYAFGMRLGAVVFGRGLAFGMIAVAVEWALLMPAILYIQKQLFRDD